MADCNHRLVFHGLVRVRKGAVLRDCLAPWEDPLRLDEDLTVEAMAKPEMGIYYRWWFKHLGSIYSAPKSKVKALGPLKKVDYLRLDWGGDLVPDSTFFKNNRGRKKKGEAEGGGEEEE